MALLKYLFLLLINIIIGVFSSNLDDPCGGSNPVEGTEGQGLNIDFSTALTGIVNAALEAKQLAGLLKRKYSNMSDPHVRISKRTASRLEGFHLQNFTYAREQLNTVNKTLQQDYFDVSVIVVFMETVYSQEEFSANNFILEMYDFKSSVMNTLCKIKISSDGLHLVSADDSRMPSAYKNLATTTQRFQRDYVIFRDAEIYLDALSTGYSSYTR